MSHSPFLWLYILLILGFGQQDTVPWDNVTACAVGDNPESAGTSRPPFAPTFDEGDAVRVGVIAGVAVGCTVAVLAIFGTGAWFFWRRHRRRRQQQQDRPASPQLEPYSTAEQDNGMHAITPWTPNSDKKFYVRAPQSTTSFLLRMCALMLFASPPRRARSTYRIPRTRAPIQIPEFCRQAPPTRL